MIPGGCNGMMWRRASEIVFNPRQLTMMVRLLVGGLALRSVTSTPKFSDPDANTAYVESNAAISKLPGLPAAFSFSRT